MSLRWSRLIAVSAIGIGAIFVATTGGATPAAPASRDTANCPWAAPSALSTSTPKALAAQVVAQMTTAEKISTVVLNNIARGYENINTAIPRLCIPALVLQDGPVGLSIGDRGVTQLPSSVALAATFDQSAARAYGGVLGEEARNQGISGVQGPGMNIARLPNWGRNFENLGEDPYLTGLLATAEVQGMSKAGVLAVLKHFGPYGQEIDRIRLNQLVSDRALNETYLAPFRMAVASAKVGGIMCSYGQINGTNICQNPAIYKLLASWGFNGFVRSDLKALTDPVAALNAGLDISKPDPSAVIAAALGTGTLTNVTLNRAVVDVLSAMFSFDLIAHPATGNFSDPVSTEAHLAVAQNIATESTVLLRNNATLPLSATTKSIAVIGAAADASPLLSGTGSAKVRSDASVTALSGITAAFPRSQITYYPATSQTGIVSLFTKATNGIRSVDYPGFAEATMTLPATLSGHVTFSMTTAASASLTIDGRQLVTTQTIPSDRIAYIGSTTLVLSPKVVHTITVDWKGTVAPEVSAQAIDPILSAAQAIAKAAKVAIVVVATDEGENYDRQTLALSGYDDALIEAVAAANPRTVIDINSGGPVLMPWLKKVGAVLESWFPGQTAGGALGAIVSGAATPSGHLPITFPRSDAASPMSQSASWPQINDTVDLNIPDGSGLATGQHYYDALGLTPLFPFGFGLSYTTFSLSNPMVTTSPGALRIAVTVTNTGTIRGRAVVESYLTYPSGTGEPSSQFRGAGAVMLQPGARGTAVLTLPTSAFTSYDGTSMSVVPGMFTLGLGWAANNQVLKLQVSAPRSLGLAHHAQRSSAR